MIFEFVFLQIIYIAKNFFTNVTFMTFPKTRRYEIVDTSLMTMKISSVFKRFLTKVAFFPGVLFLAIMYIFHMIFIFFCSLNFFISCESYFTCWTFVNHLFFIMILSIRKWNYIGTFLVFYVFSQRFLKCKRFSTFFTSKHTIFRSHVTFIKMLN